MLMILLLGSYSCANKYYGGKMTKGYHKAPKGLKR